MSGKKKSERQKWINDGFKFCNGCNQNVEYPDGFIFNKNNTINECRRCNSERAIIWRLNNFETQKNKNLEKSFGISLDEYREILESQRGVCKICGKPETEMRLGKVKELAVDHCHETGFIRGLLCAKCNCGIGNFKENIDSLKNAITYLEENSKKINDIKLNWELNDEYYSYESFCDGIKRFEDVHIYQ